MENEAQSPAVTRLEAAITALETALRDRPASPADNAGDAALRQRHDALKASVAACLGEIDTMLAGADQGSSSHA
ncbi:MAG: hypothetical protein GW859_02885 [Sphingomonadales bacterium]|nr:hypothetical protein [Sphingomonadales bacterium]